MVETQATETVLLVEDEPSLRQLMRRMLEGSGYMMMEACNGVDAMEVARKQTTPIKLLLTDVVMPAMDGFELARQVSAIHPETRVLFLSGHADDRQGVREGLGRAPSAFLLKPFTQATLKAKIREVLDTPLA